MNYLRTGYRTEGILDVHIITGEDIARRSSYASKIGAITDPARTARTQGTRQRRRRLILPGSGETARGGPQGGAYRLGVGESRRPGE